MVCFVSEHCPLNVMIFDGWFEKYEIWGFIVNFVKNND